MSNLQGLYIRTYNIKYKNIYTNIHKDIHRFVSKARLYWTPCSYHCLYTIINPYSNVIFQLVMNWNLQN